MKTGDLPDAKPWDEFRHPRGKNRIVALRAYARILILSRQNIGPRSEKGAGAQRWKRANLAFYQALGWRPGCLGDQMKLERWVHRALGYRQTTINRITAWRRTPSRATVQRQKQWAKALAQARTELSDWCLNPREIETRAQELMST